MALRSCQSVPEKCAEIQLDQLLQALTGQLGDHPSAAAIE